MPAPERYEIGDVTEAEWGLFVGDAVGATPFSVAAWIRSAAAAMAAHPRLLGVRKDGRLVAGVAGCEAGRGWRRRFVTPDLLPHTGFLFAPATSDRVAHVESEQVGAATALVEHLQAQYPRVLLTHAPALTDARPFLWHGWQVTPRYTYQLDLPPDRQTVWERFERRTRTAVRKAEKAGYLVEATDDAADLRRLYGAVYDGEARAPVAGEIVERLAADALTEGRARGWCCRTPAGPPAAVVLFVEGAGILYAWVAGADPAQRDSGAASLLYWKVLEATGCSRFDFVGANLASVAFFKRGFGGDLVPYVATAGYGSALLRRAHDLRGVLRR